MTLNKSGKLLPQIKKISYQLIRNITSLSIGSTEFHRVVEFGGAEWIDIYYSPSTAKFSEQPNRVDAGIEYDQKLTFKFPGEISEKYTGLKQAERFGCVVRIEYEGGLVKLIGTNEVPAYFDFNFQSDSDEATSVFSFTCIATERAYLLE